jgi:hypothetical protein
MLYKQPAFSQGILWGEGTIAAEGVKIESTLAWTARPGFRGVLGATTAKWISRLVDPMSMGLVNADSVLISGAVPAVLKVGPAGAWFYPPVRQ